jgi:hypothetical protein
MKLEYSTAARCAPEAVWAAFTESSRWGEWSDLLAGVHFLDGEPWKPGSSGVIELKQPAFKLKATVKESSPPSKVVWTGAAMGVNIENTFEFLGQTDGTTLMKATIDLSGPGTFFINEDMKKKGLAAFEPWFNALRDRAQQSAASS